MRVETLGANISEAAHITARSTRPRRSTIPSGKQVPSRSLGILSVMAPTWVSSPCSLKPLRDAPVSSHIASARADITSLTHASTSARATAPGPPSAIAPSNCRIVSIAVSVSVESFSWPNRILGRGPRFFSKRSYTAIRYAIEVGRVLPYDGAGDDDDAPDGAGPAPAFAYTGSPAALFASGPSVMKGTYSMEKLQVASALVAALEQGRAVELAVVTGTRGSSPRSAGAWMAVDATGSIAGTVGGGAVEDIAIREAVELLAAGSSRTVSYTMGGRVSDTGMVCGGMIDLCYLYLDSDKLEFFKQLEKVLVERGDGALEIDLAPFAAARPADAPAHGAESAATIVGAPALSVVDVEPGVAAGVSDVDGAPVYLEPLCPEGLTYIFGSGHVGRALAPVLAGAGFAVVSCDNRAEMLSEELLPGVLDRRLVDYGDLSATCEIGPRDIVISSTAGHGSDFAVVSQALAAHPAYLGCLGSKKKTAFIHGKLAEEGYSDEDIASIHMPIGIKIGAETPNEIAISIAAELIAHRRHYQL